MDKNFFTIEDDIYPENLKNIYNPPKKIYYRGKIEILKNIKMISIVGTRNNTHYGAMVCEKIVKELTQAGVTVVSGFAMGIDSIAHRVSLENNGTTIAVVASGLDFVYPSANLKLWKELEEKGLILSEYEMGVKPYRANFPKRNRIIAGLSKATVIIESKQKGGSLITADIALEENRDVYAIPSDIFSENSKGCNSLIKECKAKLLTSADEILEDYNWIDELKKIEEKKYKNLTKIQIRILDKLSTEKTLDKLLEETDLEGSVALSEIMELEILGMIKGLPGGRYIKIF